MPKKNVLKFSLSGIVYHSGDVGSVCHPDRHRRLCGGQSSKDGHQTGTSAESGLVQGAIPM
jgi:hypothetical protein